MFDTHAHLNFKAFDKDRDQIIKKCLQENIWMINVGTNFFSSKLAVEIANNYSKGVYASVGLHPINISNLKSQNSKPQLKTQNFKKDEDVLEENFDYKKYKKLAENKKVVAIGEIGLDYYYKPKTKRRQKEFKDKQKEIFLQQLDLAKELNLPIIFHCRMAHQDLIELLKQKNINEKQKIEGVVHCFTGSWEQAEEYLKMGFYLGFNGIIFKLDLDEVIKKTPLERLLIETDCPYLTPPGFENERNDPRGVKFIIEKIAKLKGLSFEEIAQETHKNALCFFKINY